MRHEADIAPVTAGRVAALFDIHGNAPALEAALTHIAQSDVDLIVVGGDVLPGPMPRETLDMLATTAIPVRCITGNGEREALEVRAGREPITVPADFRDVVRWSAGRLTADQARAIEGWTHALAVDVDGVGRVLFCHATPRNDTEIFTKLTPEESLLPVFAGVGAGLVVCGHTHMQFDRRIGATRIVNAGSVGMPFGEPGAYWALIGARVDLIRTPYDLARAAELIRRTRYPRAA